MGDARTTSGTVTIVPGVVGPRRVIDPRGVLLGETVTDLHLDIRWDPELRRYICYELRARRSTGATPAGPITTESLRHLKVAGWITLAFVGEESLLKELPNPDGREPWGFAPPVRLRAEGPSPRLLAWVAHVYKLHAAIGRRPAVAIEELFEVSRATAGRWVMLARDAGLLGPSEGPGRVGG